MSRFHKLLIVAAIPMIFALGFWFGSASASEGGVSTFRPGLNDLNSGDLPAAGTTMAKTSFLYQDADADAFTSTSHVHANTIIYTQYLSLVHVTDFTLLGAQIGFGGVGQTRILQQQKGSAPIGEPITPKNLTVGGFGDMVLSPIIMNWDFRNLHLLSVMKVYAPSGSYDKTRIVNVGLNRWAMEPDFGVTWNEPDTGRHASLFVGYTINARNSATEYRSGDEFHADFVAAQYLPHGFVAGVTGYAVQQTTRDTGSGAIYGSREGRVVALGPLVGKKVTILNMPVNFSFKYDFEFAAQNRLTGNELWVSAGLSF